MLNSKISTRLWALMGLLGALAVVAVLIFNSVLDRVSIGSERYTEIVEAKDVQASVLPPPMYLVETHLLVNELATDRDLGVAEERITRIGELEKEYQTEYARWDRASTDARIRQALRSSDIEVKEYYELLTPRFFSNARASIQARQDALAADRKLSPREQGRAEQVNELVQGTLDPIYLEHRSYVDEVVALSAAKFSRAEVAADTDRIQSRNFLLISIGVIGSLALLLGASIIRAINQRVGALRKSATEEFPRVVNEVKAAAEAGESIPAFVPVPISKVDELSDAEQAFNNVVGTAVDLAADQARMRQSTSEMFVNLGRRNHKLLSRTLAQVSELEHAERDPETLRNLFRLDHLITRMRRNAESLLVLAGATPMRTWAQPVPIDDVLRAALSEVESYERVDLRLSEPLDVKGTAASDIAHLMAELIENATTYSSPESRTTITGGPDQGGYLLFLSDEGLGIDSHQQRILNERLASGTSDLEDTRRLGLGVVARLASRHGVKVQLSQNSVGGVLVRIAIPAEALALGGDAAPEKVAVASAPPIAPDPSVIDVPAEPAAVEVDQSPGGSGVDGFSFEEEMARLIESMETSQAAPARPSEAKATEPRRTAPPEAPRQARVADTPVDLVPAPAAQPEPRVQSSAPSVVQSSAQSSAQSGVQPGALPRRVRGANVDQSLRQPPAPDNEPSQRTAEQLRSSLTDFASGQQAASGAPIKQAEAEQAEIKQAEARQAQADEEMSEPKTTAVAPPAPAKAAPSAPRQVSEPKKPDEIGASELPRRVRGVNMDTSVSQAPVDADLPARDAETVKASLANFAAGQRAAHEKSDDGPSPDTPEAPTAQSSSNKEDV
ncbi:MAG: ATP-binding protein [Nocardioides sp.]